MKPAALLFVAPDCPHCAAVKRGLDELVRQGLIGEVAVVDAAAHPERAAEYGVRTVPWLRLGPFTLTGAQSVHELRQWAEWANGEEGIARYVAHLLKLGEFQHAAAFVSADAQRLAPLLDILSDTEAGIDLRLGVSALLERYADTPGLRNLLPQLAELSRHADHRVRADACHLLGLTGSAEALAHVESRLSDENEEVREIAAEAMQRLGGAA
ncbi:MAG TPA: HEAT repeat domain-containing protein [Gallionella sp.]|nr:HEAT repeat domain-containing protein [Gallionella sp.]